MIWSDTANELRLVREKNQQQYQNWYQRKLQNFPAEESYKMFEVMTEASGQQVWLMKTVFRGSRRGLFFSSVAEMEKSIWWKDSSSSCSISSSAPSHTSTLFGFVHYSECGGSKSQTLGWRHSDLNMSSCLLLRLQPTCWSTRCASPSPSSTRCRASGSSAAPSASCCPTPRGSPCTSPRWRSTSSPWTATGGWGLKMGGDGGCFSSSSSLFFSAFS